MNSRRLIAISLLGLSLAAAVPIVTSQTALAQGLRGRLRNRLDGDQNNSNTQQNSNQQSNPSQQQMPAQQNGGQQMSGAADISVVTLETRPGPEGSQMVVTPKGMVVPLPGQGVNSNAVQVYIGGQGGYWYVDKNGQQVDLTPAVNAFQRMNGGGQQPGNMPQQVNNVPQYEPQPQVVNNYNAPQQSGSSGMGAMGTATAAGLGAMAGSAMGSAMYNNNVPYGTPIHYGANAMPYYNQGGKPVYVNNSKSVDVNQVNANQVNSMHANQVNANQVNDMHANQVNANQVNDMHANQANDMHANSMQQQQDWYKKQQSAQSSQWKNWQKQGSSSNPFVRSEYQNGESHSGQAAAAEEKSGGRFGRGAAGEEAGRMGRGAGEARGRLRGGR
jgi:hypothetical protein